MTTASTLLRPVAALFAACVFALLVAQGAHAQSDPYRAAVPALEQAGGAKTCVTCFIERYAPAEQPKAFAVSKDGAYGARWHRQLSMDQVRRDALDSCQKKPEFKPENPCVVFFENDQLVWKP